jgi:leucyl/phenylalanyl-tRNA--protein transferase
MIPWLPAEPIFPPVQLALSEPDGPNGLLAAGGDLSPTRILAAYRQGIFPWFSPGDPILWWSPDPRMVLLPTEFRISRSLAKTLRNLDYEVRLDTMFADVIGACAHTPRHGQPGTWITREMQAAYCRLHELGYTHSVETWMQGELVGGLYGIALGRAFYGESMFSHRPDASKIALAHLCVHLRRHDFGIIDCQMETAHLTSLGARPIPRRDFLALLDRLAVTDDRAGRWPADGVLDAFKRAGLTKERGAERRSD